MTNIKIWTLTLICFILIFFIGYKIKQPLTVQNYLINTYLYIALALALVGTSWLCMSEYDITQPNPFILLITAIGSLFVVLFTSNDQIITKHIAWTTLILSMAMTSHIFIKINVESNKLLKTFLTLFGIVGLFTYISLVSDTNVFLNMGNNLTMALCVAVIIEIIDLLFFTNESAGSLVRSNMWNWLIIVLFCGFLLYDTKKIVSNGKIVYDMCDSKNQSKCADYPVESLGVFLDILNLFQRISIVNTN